MKNENSKPIRLKPIIESDLTIGDLDHELNEQEMKDVQGGSWSGYWTWDKPTSKWNWTWVWTNEYGGYKTS